IRTSAMAPTATTMPTMIALRRVTMRRLRGGGGAPLFDAVGSGSFTGILEADLSEARRSGGGNLRSSSSLTRGLPTFFQESLKQRAEVRGRRSASVTVHFV